MRRRISTAHRSVRWLVVLGLLAWIVAGICFYPCVQSDVLIESTKDIEKYDFFELLSKSRVQDASKNTETTQQLSLLELPSSDLEDNLIAEITLRLMFVRLIPKTGPPQAI